MQPLCASLFHVDQQQKQIRLRKKQLALGKARDREHKLAAQVISLASKTA